MIGHYVIFAWCNHLSKISTWSSIIRLVDLTWLIYLLSHAALTGYNNSGEEELSHWSDMRETKGTQVCRWHILLEAWFLSICVKMDSLLREFTIDVYWSLIPRHNTQLYPNHQRTYSYYGVSRYGDSMLNFCLLKEPNVDLINGIIV